MSLRSATNEDCAIVKEIIFTILADEYGLPLAPGETDSCLDDLVGSVFASLKLHNANSTDVLYCSGILLITEAHLKCWNTGEKLESEMDWKWIETQLKEGPHSDWV